MKKKTSKLISMLLAAVMVLSMAMTGLAAEVDPLAHSGGTDGITGSITINSAESGETYTIYQIFDLTYADDKTSYSYKVVDAWKSFVSSYTYTDNTGATANLFSLDDNGYLEIDSKVFDEQDNSDVMAAFAKDALAYAKNAGITATKTITADSSTVTFSDLNLGYYLVDTTLGSLCFLDSTNPDASITEKNPTPTPEKEEYDLETDDKYTTEDTAEVGDVIDYEIFLHDVAHTVGLVLHDTMTESLAFDSQSVVVYVGYPDPTITDLFNDTTTTWTELNNGEYKLIYPATDDCTYEISFDDAWLDTLENGAVIKVYYEATVVYTENMDENLYFIMNNDVYLTYGQSSTSEKSDTYTYTVGFDIFKFTMNGEEKEELAGAQFELYRDADKTDKVSFIKSVDESTGAITYEEVDPKTYTGSASDIVTTIEAGSVSVIGLHADNTYYLTETKAPDGYNMLTSDIEITITATVSDGEVTGETVKVQYDGELVSATGNTVEIENKKGNILPGTGGMGTTLFYIVGIVLILGAAVLFVTKKRLDKE